MSTNQRESRSQTLFLVYDEPSFPELCIEIGPCLTGCHGGRGVLSSHVSGKLSVILSWIHGTIVTRGV